MDTLTIGFVVILLGAGLLLTLTVRRDLQDREERARSLREERDVEPSRRKLRQR
jgi:hypothetical protein